MMDEYDDSFDPKAIQVSEMSEVENVWIAPNGDMYAVPYMGHNIWARDFIIKKMCDGDYDRHHDFIIEITGRSMAYPYQALHKLGWVRIQTWGSGIPKLLTEGIEKLTNHQSDALLFWCGKNEVDFDQFVIKLNNF